MKTALFVAGDKNIFFPAIVALNSIAVNNPDIFDLHICFDERDLTSEMNDALLHYGVKFVPSKEMEAYGSIENLPLMKEGNWPSEVFLNWILPNYFHAKGYATSIKVDYDILCIAPYEYADIDPGEKILSALSFDVNFEAEGVSKDLLFKWEQSGVYKKGVRSYINAGFIVFNNKLYSDFNFYNKLKNLYIEVIEKCPGVRLAEQVAAAITLTSTVGIKELPTVYNQRVLWGAAVDDHLIPSIKNIHYITSLKPWRPLDKKMVPHFVKLKQGFVFCYRAIWLAKAAESPWFSQYCKELPLTHEQMLGINTFICHRYNLRILELEKELSSHKEKKVVTHTEETPSGSNELSQAKDRILQLEAALGRKTLENDILRDSIGKLNKV